MLDKSSPANQRKMRMRSPIARYPHSRLGGAALLLNVDERRHHTLHCPARLFHVLPTQSQTFKHSSPHAATDKSIRGRVRADVDHTQFFQCHQSRKRASASTEISPRIFDFGAPIANLRLPVALNTSSASRHPSMPATNAQREHSPYPHALKLVGVVRFDCQLHKL